VPRGKGPTQKVLQTFRTQVAITKNKSLTAKVDSIEEALEGNVAEINAN
jgi:hypothetical protein